MNKKNNSNKSTKRISIKSSEPVDLFETLCSASSSKEACRRFVDRLEEASRNITSPTSDSWYVADADDSTIIFRIRTGRESGNARPSFFCYLTLVQSGISSSPVANPIMTKGKARRIKKGQTNMPILCCVCTRHLFANVSDGFVCDRLVTL